MRSAHARRWHPPERSGPAFALSLLVHGLLFIAIAFVVRWKTEPAGTVAVELWGGLPPPPAVEVPRQPPPVVKPPPVEPPPEPRKADIVEQKAEPKVEPPKKVEPPPEPPKKIEPPKKVEPPKKIEPDLRQEQLKRDAETKAAQAAAEKQRQAAIERAMAAAGTSSAGVPGGSPATGPGGMARGYESQVVGCIRPHIVYNVPESLQARQHVAEFEVTLLPTGEQVGAPRLLRPSGIAAYDQAVERAIRRCDPFPRPREGAMPRSLRLAFDPVETR